MKSELNPILLNPNKSHSIPIKSHEIKLIETPIKSHEIPWNSTETFMKSPLLLLETILFGISKPSPLGQVSCLSTSRPHGWLRRPMASTSPKIRSLRGRVEGRNHPRKITRNPWTCVDLFEAAPANLGRERKIIEQCVWWSWFLLFKLSFECGISHFRQDQLSGKQTKGSSGDVWH